MFTVDARADNIFTISLISNQMTASLFKQVKANIVQRFLVETILVFLDNVYLLPQLRPRPRRRRRRRRCWRSSLSRPAACGRAARSCSAAGRGPRGGSSPAGYADERL